MFKKIILFIVTLVLTASFTPADASILPVIRLFTQNEGIKKPKCVYEIQGIGTKFNNPDKILKTYELVGNSVYEIQGIGTKFNNPDKIIRTYELLH